MKIVLTYHSIDDSGSVISTSAAHFRQQMEWLAKSHVKVVPLDAIVSAKSTDDTVAITFDDGYQNFAQVALPILERLKFPSTVFVVSDLAGKKNIWDARSGGIPQLPLMNWNSIGQCVEAGVTIGAHGRTHCALQGLTSAEVSDELAGSAGEIESRTGKVPGSFAYPFGIFDETSCVEVKRRFAIACTTELREISRKDLPHELPRLDAFYLRTPGILEKFGTARFGAWLRLRNAARQARSAFSLR